MVAIAKTLNERGVRTARGGQWHVSSVANLLARANNARWGDTARFISGEFLSFCGYDSC